MIFKRNKDGTNYTLLHVFQADDGGSPERELLETAGGFLYGTTPYGGDSGLGVVYRQPKDGD